MTQNVKQEDRLISSNNLQIIEKLSVRAPPADLKLKVLKAIAQEYNLEWDSSNTEAEFSKKHEDLLVCFLVAKLLLDISSFSHNPFIKINMLFQTSAAIEIDQSPSLKCQTTIPFGLKFFNLVKS